MVKQGYGLMEKKMLWFFAYTKVFINLQMRNYKELMRKLTCRN